MSKFDKMGTPSAGYANTIPMVSSSNGMWGVFDKTQEKFVNVTWHTDANDAIEAYDEFVISGKRAAVPAKPKIQRERGGEKAQLAVEMNKAFASLKLQEAAYQAHLRYPHISTANFRYLINKLRSV